MSEILDMQTLKQINQTWRNISEKHSTASVILTFNYITENTHGESKNCATVIFTVILVNIGRF